MTAGYGEPGVASRISSAAHLLGGIPLFQRFGKTDLVALSRLAQRKRYRKNEVVFHEGDVGNGLFVVLKGQVRILVRSVEGKEVVIAIRRTGDFFGEMALLDDETRSATAVASEPSELLLIRRDDFNAFLKSHSELAIEMLAVLSRRLRATTQLVQSISFLDVRERLVRVLLDLTQAESGSTSNGEVLLRLTQGEVAEMVGATRESVNKWLRHYERLGVLRLSRGKVVVLQPERLAGEL